jgi:hypothetical protein
VMQSIGSIGVRLDDVEHAVLTFRLELWEHAWQKNLPL